MDSKNRILEELKLFLEPFLIPNGATATQDLIITLLSDGIYFNSNEITSFSNDLLQLIKNIQSFNSDDSGLDDLLEGIYSLDELIKSLRRIDTQDLEGVSLEGKQIIYSFLNYLFIEYLKNYPNLYYSFRFLGIVKESYDRYSYRTLIDFENLQSYLSGDYDAFWSTYQWNSSGFNSLELYRNIYPLLDTWGIENYLLLNENTELTFLIELFRQDSESLLSKLGLELKKEGNNNLLITPNIEGDVSFQAKIDEAEFSLISSLDVVPEDFGIEVSPGSILFKDSTSNYDKPFSIFASFNFPSEIDKPLNIFALGPLVIDVASLGLAMEINSPSQNTFNISIPFNSGSINVENESSSGLIKKLLPFKSINIPFDLVLGFSPQMGFYIEGNSTTSIFLPIHKKLGPVEINILLLEFTYRENALRLICLIDFNALLGPVTFLVGGFGAKSRLDFEEKGNLGFANLEKPSLTPPTEIGIIVASKLIYGGGFLNFSQEDSTYSGILALNIKDKFEIVAIGLIQTRMPDGSEGFSMIASISVVFTPGIPLPFGFSLIGIGGLVGINRRLNLEVLKERLYAGAVDSIMFPDDALNNAAQLFSDLQAVFPAEKDKYIAAPMIKLGWGPPGMLSAEMGLILEFPFQGRIIAVGTISVFLPPPLPVEEASEELSKPKVEIHVDILGDFNFEERYIMIIGVLRDSHIVGYPLTGGFAFYIGWGKKVEFAITIGGFHPQYEGPSRLPFIGRLALNMSQGENLQIYCDVYLAITSNSFQFGARADLYARHKKAWVEGYLRFNTLLLLDPFYFTVDFSLRVTAYYKNKELTGVILEFNLSGPAPWRASGYAEFKILGIKFTPDFNFVWGRRDTQSLEPVDPWPLLKSAINNRESWGAILPEGTKPSVTFKEPQPQVDNGGTAQVNDAILLYPGAFLELRQQLVPLDFELEKFGDAPIANGKQSFQIKSIQVAKEEPVLFEDSQIIRENFARGQFQKLSKNAKLTEPSFELFHAGLTLKADKGEIRVGGTPEKRVFGYENILINKDLTSYKGLFVNPLPWEVSGHAVLGDRILHFDPQIDYLPEDIYDAGLDEGLGAGGFQIVDIDTLDTNEFFGEQVFGTFAEATSAISQQVDAGNIFANEVQIFNTAELATELF